jgi:DNA-binding SARP family transcriptional activator
MPGIAFRILGPLEVDLGWGPVPIPGVKPRAVLAILLGRVGRVTATAELLDLLWGGEPQSGALRILHSYVSQLRRALGPPGPAPARSELIVTRAPGYLLDVAPDAVDAFRFERLVAEARKDRVDPLSRAALAGDGLSGHVPGLAGRPVGNPHRAAELLREALALWRGPVLADLPAAMVGSGLASKLAEAQLEAVEARIDADLAVGRHAELVGELASLVADHPLRERLQAQLMLALYRCGRQIDALGAYRRARTALVEENGLEPGAVLVELQKAILRHDPALLHASDAVPIQARERPRPDQLPVALADFTGRQQAIAELERHLNGGPEDRRSGPVVVLTGPPGVGKSALAVEIANRLRPRYPDGRLWASLGNGSGLTAAAPDPSPTVAAFLRALGAAEPAIPSELDDRAALYRSLLTRRRVLIVLDDVADEAQVRSLLPGSPTAAVLATTCGRLPGLEGAHHVEVAPLPPADAVELLGRVVGAERVAAEPDAAAAVADLCDRIPLAIRIAGIRLTVCRDRPIAWLWRRLTDECRRLDELVAGALSVRASLRRADLRLGDRERAALRRLSLLGPADLDAATAAGVLRTGPMDAEDLLDRLADASLLSPRSRGLDLAWSWPSSLVWLFARELAAADELAATPVPSTPVS